MTRERFIDHVKAQQEPLRRFLLGLCSGDAALADDIAQDALVRAYVASGSFLGLSKFSTWLFRIAYNCYLDHLRKPVRETVSTDHSEALYVTSSDTSDAAFRYQQLYQALEKIPEKERAAIVLHYFEDRSIKEISAILQIPAGTVKYHLSRGRNHLRELITL
ncbi:MAG: RNA polymerase sigma factor [Bacteroidales bacterium]|nr:RNA polymerase sigma factor [Bacteroidales bacterium]